MLNDQGVEHHYREYRKQPLSEEELRALFSELDQETVESRSWLRTRDRAFKEHGLKGDESLETLIPLMAESPTLLQRPIGRLNGRAVIGRPVEALLSLLA